MGTSRYIQSPDPPYNLIPADEFIRPVRGILIMPDLPDFVSPIDNKVINGRRGLREHNQRHNVTNAADFKETWKAEAKARKNLVASQRKDRIEVLKYAVEKHRKS